MALNDTYKSIERLFKKRELAIEDADEEWEEDDKI